MVSISGSCAEFLFYRPAAGQVFLAGDFNGWRPSQLPMTRNSEGYWTAVLCPPAGSYKFRYIADGRWFCDFAASGIEPGPFGPDAVVRIPPASEMGRLSALRRYRTSPKARLAKSHVQPTGAS